MSLYPTTTVSATVRDQNGNLYSYARVAFDLIPASGTSVPANYTTQVIAYTDGNGYFSTLLASNDGISPAGSTWSCSVIASDRVHSFICSGINVTGTTLDLSSTLQDASVLLSASSITTFGEVSITYSSTPTFNAALGSIFRITLTGDVSSSTLSNPLGGQLLTFIITQDSSGGHNFVWPTAIQNGAIPDTTANAITVQSFIYNSPTSKAYPVGPPTIN